MVTNTSVRFCRHGEAIRFRGFFFPHLRFPYFFPRRSPSPPSLPRTSHRSVFSGHLLRCLSGDLCPLLHSTVSHRLRFQNPSHHLHPRLLPLVSFQGLRIAVAVARRARSGGEGGGGAADLHGGVWIGTRRCRTCRECRGGRGRK